MTPEGLILAGCTNPTSLGGHLGFQRLVPEGPKYCLTQKAWLVLWEGRSPEPRFLADIDMQRRSSEACAMSYRLLCDLG